MLAKFQDGERIVNPQRWMSRVKNLARPLAHRLYSGLR